MKQRTSQLIETLRLNDREKTMLLWAIEQANIRDEGKNQRRLRVACTHNEAVFTLKSEGGRETRLSMLARNLSRWGAALVHGRFIHTDSRGELTIQSNNGTLHKIPGVVRHCRHIQGMIHEIGITFDEPIDLSEFVSLTPADETRYLRELADDTPASEDIEVLRLSSRVLVVDDFASDRKLFSHWLTQAGLTVTTCSDIRSAIEQVQEQVFDLLIIDYRLGLESGADLIRALRQAQHAVPIIAISTDDSPEMIATTKDSGAEAFMKKPFTEEQLVETAYKLIGIDSDTDLTPIFSDLKDEADMRPLLTEFTRSLSAYIEELRDANAQNDFEVMEYISRRLKGSGSGYGFPDITERANEVLVSLHHEEAEIEKIKQATSDLITTLNRVKMN